MWELHRFKTHHWVVLGYGKGLGGGGSTEQGGSAAEASDGEGAPVRFRRGEVAWELREVEAVLKVGAVGVERVWGGGSAAGWSSPGFKRGGGGVLRCGSEERARERGEWVSGVPLLPGRALGDGGGSLSRAVHGGVAVAVAGVALEATRGCQRTAD